MPPIAPSIPVGCDGIFTFVALNKTPGSDAQVYRTHPEVCFCSKTQTASRICFGRVGRFITSLQLQSRHRRGAQRDWLLLHLYVSVIKIYISVFDIYLFMTIIKFRLFMFIICLPSVLFCLLFSCLFSTFWLIFVGKMKLVALIHPLFCWLHTLIFVNLVYYLVFIVIYIYSLIYLLISLLLPLFWKQTNTLTDSTGSKGNSFSLFGIMNVL